MSVNRKGGRACSAFKASASITPSSSRAPLTFEPRALTAFILSSSSAIAWSHIEGLALGSVSRMVRTREVGIMRSDKRAFRGGRITWCVS